MPPKAIDVLEKAIGHGIFRRGLQAPSKRNNWGTPGEVVQSLSEDDRKFLRSLKAEDTWNFSLDSDWAQYCDPGPVAAKWNRERDREQDGFNTPLVRQIEDKVRGRGY